MNHGFSGKSVLITGAGGGIGGATALAFAAAGARLALADIDQAAGAETEALMQATGGTALFVRTDVTCAAEVEALGKATVAAYGRLDCAFNNAGIEIEHMRITECAESTFDSIMAVNVKGVWLCLECELAQMALQGGGAIVNTASVAGLKAAPKMATYAASKHAVLGLTKTAAVEFARKKVRVNAVCPGVIRTAMYARALKADPAIASRVAAMHPLRRFGEADEVAAAVLWLCSDAASFVTGHAQAVDSGFGVI